MLRILAACTALVATAALAQDPGGTSAAPTTKRGPSGDSGEIVCISETQTGSRLGRRRVCRTREEWEQHRAEFKQEVERAQQQMQTQYVDPGT